MIWDQGEFDGKKRIFSKDWALLLGVKKNPSPISGEHLIPQGLVRPIDIPGTDKREILQIDELIGIGTGHLLRRQANFYIFIREEPRHNDWKAGGGGGLLE
jgi:hypothetical protein